MRQANNAPRTEARAAGGGKVGGVPGADERGTKQQNKRDTPDDSATRQPKVVSEAVTEQTGERQWGGSLTHPHVTHEFGWAVVLIIDTGHR